MQFILWLLLALFLYWLVKNIIIPVFTSYMLIKRKQKEFREEQKRKKEGGGFSSNRPEGHVEIRESKDHNKREQSTSDEGDYIDYKEVK